MARLSVTARGRNVIGQADQALRGRTDEAVDWGRR